MAILNQSKDELTIITEFGYTYKLVKTESGSIVLEESFDEADVKEATPTKREPVQVPDTPSDDNFFSWE